MTENKVKREKEIVGQRGRVDGEKRKEEGVLNRERCAETAAASSSWPHRPNLL